MQGQISRRKAPSDAVRQAAIAARRLKMLTPVDKAAPEVFVVRTGEHPAPFGWEIRRFGSIVLHRGETSYPTPGIALRAGRTCLDQQTS